MSAIQLQYYGSIQWCAHKPFRVKYLLTTAAMFSSCPNMQLSGGFVPVSLKKNHTCFNCVINSWPIRYQLAFTYENIRAQLKPAKGYVSQHLWYRSCRYLPSKLRTFFHFYWPSCFLEINFINKYKNAIWMYERFKK